METELTGLLQVLGPMRDPSPKNKGHACLPCKAQGVLKKKREKGFKNWRRMRKRGREKEEEQEEEEEE